MALLRAHQYDDPPPLTAVRPDFPPQTDAVLAKALAKSPDDRYASGLDLVAALRTAMAGGGEATTAPTGHTGGGTPARGAPTGGSIGQADA
ncbi:hypothetical protein [Streptomyces sp. TE5632]